MKCMSVFKVDYPTEVSINCNECVKKEWTYIRVEFGLEKRMISHKEKN